MGKNRFTGKVQMVRDGSIFVIVEGREGNDIFVRPQKSMGALNGDTVTVAVNRTPKKGGRIEGAVTEIVSRSTKPFVGVFHTVGAQAWVLMQSKNMPYDIRVDAEDAAAKGAVRGYKVAVLADGWYRGENCPHGHITDVLGPLGENETEMHAILAEFNLPYRFDERIEKEAGRISGKIGRKELKGRRDFRDAFTFTIDPSDAKDFDDALSLEALENGNFEVGVHIADVSWYVAPGGEIDREARDRGTSVYLVDRTVPMLPEKLCNSLCSLREGEDKLTFSCVFEMTPDAKVRKSWIGRTVIRSDRRLDYEKAQELISMEDTSSLAPDDGRIAGALKTLDFMARILKERRFKAGAIDFDRPEIKVEVDSEGRPVNVYQKSSTASNWLIEEFMLLANRTVASFVEAQGKTFVYRIHDMPDVAKLASLKAFAKGFGYRMEGKLEGKEAARSISGLLGKAKGKPEFNAFEDIALRSMAKAKYSTDNIGHYGLAFESYTHFTSPIRRYPDLMVHRLLASYLDRKGSADKRYFEQECEYASSREQLAADAERASVKYKLVEFMQDKIGLEFNGHISGLTEWGMYVQIEPSGIEGMVSLREIRSDFFAFDEVHYRLVGRRTGKRFRLGDQVRIKVTGASLEQRLLDFQLVEEKA